MIRVTCAVIRNEENEVLVVQRGEKRDHPFKWEFPGGKIKENESEEECIIREIHEELSMEIVICERLSDVEYDYGIKQIVLIPFICDTLEELPVLMEHAAFKWITAEKLPAIDFLEADIVVAEEYIRKLTDQSNKDESKQQDPVNEEELRSMVASIRGSREAEFIAASAVENPAILNKIFEYSFSKDKKLSFHASWALSKTCDKYPEIIGPHLSDLIDGLDIIDTESVERSFLRAASLADLTSLDGKRQGRLADHCFASLRSGFSAIAVKAYAMEILYKLVLIYPDLVKEFSDTINMITGDGSAGIIAKGKIVLKRIEKDFKARGSNRP